MSFPGAQVGGAVEVAVGDGFHDVVGEDVVAAFEVGDGAGDFQDAVHGVAQFFQFTSSDRMNSRSSMTEYSYMAGSMLRPATMKHTRTASRAMMML